MKIFRSFMFTALLFCVTTPVFSMDYIVGARAGFFMWDSWFKDIHSQFNEVGIGSGVLYGPVASVLFTDDLSLSVSGLFGSQSTNGRTANASVSGSSDLQTNKFTFEVFRIDVDSAVSYRIMENLKIFAGYKFQNLDSEYASINYRYNNLDVLQQIYDDRMDIKQPFHGPALGVGFSMPLGSRGFFVAANLSAIYMIGYMDMKWKRNILYEAPWTGAPDPRPNMKFDMHTYGFNLEPTIGLNPGEGLPIMTLGLRYQFTRLKVTEDTGAMEMNENWINDMVYGVFVGVLYQF